MPRNSRPGGLFGDWQYGWDGTTLNERIQAQNVWDLLAEQERANEINEERLKIEKERLAQQQKEYKDNIQAAKLIDESNKQKIKSMEVLRLMQLCDNLGTDFNDIATFAIKYFEFVDINTVQQYDNQINQLNKEIQNIQNSLYTTMDNALEQIQKRRQGLQTYMSMLRKKMRKQSIIRKLLYPEEYNNKKRELQKIQKQYEALDKQEKETINYIQENESKIIEDKQNKIHLKQQQIQQIQEQKDKYINYTIEQQKQFKNDFNKFRTYHYNEDMEMLFRKLNIPFDKVQCKKEGTVKEYNKYILNKIEK